MQPQLVQPAQSGGEHVAEHMEPQAPAYQAVGHQPQRQRQQGAPYRPLAQRYRSDPRQDKVGPDAVDTQRLKGAQLQAKAYHRQQKHP